MKTKIILLAITLAVSGCTVPAYVTDDPEFLDPLTDIEPGIYVVVDKG